MTKQDAIKLIVPRLVTHLKTSVDSKGDFFLDNVDAGGVLPAKGVDPSYLMGLINGVIADFVFRIIAKPFLNDYRSANKQFIAPLPIPNVAPQAQADLADRARRLQQRWTDRRNVSEQAFDRLSVLARAGYPARWLWPDLPDTSDLIEQAPRGLRLGIDRRKWAEERFDDLEAAQVEALRAALARDGRRQARFDGGELRLFVGGTLVLGRIYLDEAAGRLVEAYWRWLLLNGPPREAERFAADLRRPPTSSELPAARQFIERVAALAVQVAAIEADEQAMNETLYALYRLSPDERNLVENDKGRRRSADAGR